jgi:hypothetical protein
MALGQTAWLGGALYRCSICRDEKKRAKQAYDLMPKVTAPDQLNRALLAWRGKHYAFRSYDPRCAKFWLQKYPHVGFSLPFVVTHKFALERRLLHLLKSMFGQGVKVPTIQSILKEVCDVESNFELAAAVAHLLFQAPVQCVSASLDGQQKLTQFFAADSARDGKQALTLEHSWAAGSSVPQLPDLRYLHGTCPSSYFIRELLKHDLHVRREFEMLWREQHVSGSRLMVDFSRKALKAQNGGGVHFFNSALTVGNEYGQIVLKAHCETESFSNGAASAALEVVGTI